MVSGRFLPPRLPACRCSEPAELDQFGLARLQSEAEPAQPTTQSVLYAQSVRPILETDHEVVDVAHQSGFAPQPDLHHALEPEVENIMKIQVAQQHTDRAALWCSHLARMDCSIFQDARLQPTPDQIDQAQITDSMCDEPEHPIVIEAPEEVLQIRLQHPTDLAAGDDLVEGRQGMVGTKPGSAAE